MTEARRAVQHCQSCELYRKATQAVFGEGPARATLMLIGEQPGNSEDLAGHPFAGPAGRVLDDALREAGIDRKTIYVTNVVKHFSFVERGKARIHKRPNATEVRACRPWLEIEVAALHPRVLVCLGATAAQSLISPSFKIMESRGRILDSSFGIPIAATAHPSSILRMPGADARHEARRLLAADLRAIAAHVTS